MINTPSIKSNKNFEIHAQTLKFPLIDDIDIDEWNGGMIKIWLKFLKIIDAANGNVHNVNFVIIIFPIGVKTT